MLTNIFLIISVIIILLFGLNNNEIINITIIPTIYEFQLRIYFIILSSFLIGFFCCYLLMSKKLISAKIKEWQNRKKVKSLELKLEDNDNNNDETKNKIMWHK